VELGQLGIRTRDHGTAPQRNGSADFRDRGNIYVHGTPSQT